MLCRYLWVRRIERVHVQILRDVVWVKDTRIDYLWVGSLIQGNGGATMVG